MSGFDLIEGRYEARDVSDKDIWDIFSNLFSSKSRNSSSYKYGFLKSIIDNLDNVDKNLKLTFDQLFNTFGEIYWNLVLKYGLKQKNSTKDNKDTYLEQVFNAAIKKYNIAEPMLYENLNLEIKYYISQQLKIKCKKYVVGALFEDTNRLFYSFSKKYEWLQINPVMYEFVCKHKVEIEKLNYYEWACFLKKVNNGTNFRDFSFYHQILLDEFENKQIQGTHMYLKSLELHNFRCFENIKIDFHKNVTVIIGENGSGKSSIMDGIAIALSSMFVKMDGLSSRKIDKSHARLKAYEVGSTKDVQEQYPVIVKAAASVLTPSNSKEIEWSQSIDSSSGQTKYGDANQIISLGVDYQKALREGGTQICLPIIAYYGTGRLLDYHRNKQTDVFEKSNRLNGYIDCADGTANVKLMMNWFMKMTIQKYQNQEIGLGKIPELEAVYSAMEECYSRITGYKNIKMQYSMITKELEVAYIDKNGDAMRIPINQLSDGYKSMISLVADIAYRMAVLNPQFLGNICKNTDGVVLIDEVDLHLHPAWQQRVLGDLRAIFPKVQFIVSTHAPAVINTVERESIRILKNKEVKAAPIETYGKDANSVLKAIMDADERPARVKKKFEKFYDALSDKNYRLANEILDDLKKNVGDDDPDIVTCEMELDLAEM